jgi:hypothetical protein
MLMGAGRAAISMPKLQIMEIWNGVKWNACVFRYQVMANLITLSWCGTWDLELAVEVVNAWREVALLYSGHELYIQANQRLNKQDIDSHAAAICALELSEQVIYPVSLEQIWRESKRYH